jgi:N-acetylglucosaminyl-diphospho-decaprenol L-rhamnosyltransferase
MDRPQDLSGLAIAIVSWRSAGLTIDCLRSIAAELARCSEVEASASAGSMPSADDSSPVVVVVDNDSGDRTADEIEHAIESEGWSRWARLVRAPRNGGFAYGNNIAIRAALQERPALKYVHLLNPDTLVRPSAFRILIDFLAAHPEVGIAGGRSEDPDTTAQHCCFRFPTLLGEFSCYLGIGLVDRLLARWVTRIAPPSVPLPVDWLSGAHMLIRREVLDTIGLMDEGYFLYYEETDFTLRARRAGWRCWHVPASRIVHLVGQSSGVTIRTARPRQFPAYWFESRRRYFVLNHGRVYATLTDAGVIVACALHYVRAFVQGREPQIAPEFIKDLLRHGAIRNGRASLRPSEIAASAR